MNKSVVVKEMSKYHTPALFNECIDALAIKPSGNYVDVTYGSGAHSRGIFDKLTTGHLIAFDQDSDALKNLFEDERFHFAHHNFRYITNFLKYFGFPEVDGIIADLGVSSHQFDVAGRGFSFRFAGDLDMRMNQNADKTAAEILNTYPADNLRNIFSKYGEIQNSGKLSRIIVQKRSDKEFKEIETFIDAIKDCIPRKSENKYLAKIFQALRIEVNSELDALQDFLLKTPDIIKKGGRLVVITYHSLEDRLVKNFIRSGTFKGVVETDLYGNPIAPFKAINRKVIIPTEEEIKNNNRVRSAKLRIAERL